MKKCGKKTAWEKFLNCFNSTEHFQLMHTMFLASLVRSLPPLQPPSVFHLAVLWEFQMLGSVPPFKFIIKAFC